MPVPSPYIPFELLTDDQLHELDSDAAEWYIDRICADVGVKLLPPSPPPPPERPTVSKSVRHYVVAGLRFSSDEAAKRVASAINVEAEYRRTLEHIGRRWSGPTCDTRDAEPTVDVTTEQVYNRAECEEQDGIEERTKAAKDAYDTAKREYDAVYADRSRVARTVYDRISEAHTVIGRREQIRREFARYVELAGGDQTIAARFLWKAYGTDAELIDVPRPDDVVPAPLASTEAAETIRPRQTIGNVTELL